MVNQNEPQRIRLRVEESQGDDVIPNLKQTFFSSENSSLNLKEKKITMLLMLKKWLLWIDFYGMSTHLGIFLCQKVRELQI